jgi:hypothetical protein
VPWQEVVLLSVILGGIAQQQHPVGWQGPRARVSKQLAPRGRDGRVCTRNKDN